MAGYSVADLAAAGAFSLALFSSLLLLAILSRARQDLLMSRRGWRLVALGLGLMALHGLELFVAAPWVAALTAIAGMAAALALPAGLYMILLAGRNVEVTHGDLDR